jgi:hypothetical protein
VQNQRFATLLADIELPSFLFPLLIFYALIRHKKTINILALIVLLRLVIWALGSHQIRFLLPAFPGLCLLTASMFVGAYNVFDNKRIPRILQGGLIGGVVIVTLVFTVSLYRIQPLGVITGTASKAHFLSLMVSDFRALSYIQKQIRQEDRVMFMWDGQGYYCDERCIPDTAHSRWTLMVIDANYAVSNISSQLDEAGITHLLLTKDSDFIFTHDPENQGAQAVNFFMQQYREKCTDLIYSDNWSSLYKIKCQERN